ncbi:MAG: response regulator [Terriglobales bacterium]
MTKIFVVDDNDLMCELLAASLQTGGYEVVVAASAGEALRKMEEEPPGMAFIDLQMPGMDGRTMLSKMRANPVLREVPAVAVTAFFLPGGKDEAIAMGFDSYLTKPIPRPRLLQEAHRWLD